MSNIVFDNVRKSFDGDRQVLDGVNLQISKGESHIILGRSGCGKSVLLRCLLGIFEITNGDITVDDISVKDKSRSSEYIRKFSILFQGNALFDSMTILENVEFGLKQLGKRSSECKIIAKEQLAAVGLDKNVFNLYPAEISGGMQKRAALARAIAIEPEVLLFDEPTSGLDPITGGMICRLLKDTVQRLGVTALTITHDLKVAEFLADRSSVLYNGRIVWTGKTENMKSCGNEFVEDFYRASNIIQNKPVS